MEVVALDASHVSSGRREYVTAVTTADKDRKMLLLVDKGFKRRFEAGKTNSVASPPL